MDTVVPETEVVTDTPENETPKTADDYLGYAPEIFEQLDNSESDDEQEPQQKEDIQQIINKTLKEIQVDDKGKFIYPEGISPELKAAIAATKSFRDTQSSYTKAQQELKALQAEQAALKEQLKKYETPTASLTPEQQQELDALKFTDPDAWYSKMRELEAKANSTIEEKLNEVTKQARQATAEELRLEALKEFNKSVEQPLDPQELELNTPPAWQQKVISGEWTMQEFLEKAYNFIHADKVVVNPQVEVPTNLNSVPGGDKDPQLETGIDYSATIF